MAGDMEPGRANIYKFIPKSSNIWTSDICLKRQNSGDSINLFNFSVSYMVHSIIDLNGSQIEQPLSKRFRTFVQSGLLSVARNGRKMNLNSGYFQRERKIL
jgi:hypothetical protein